MGLLEGALPRAWAVLAGAAAALGLGALLAPRLPSVPWSAPAVLVVGAPLLIAALSLLRPSLFIRNLLIFLPPALALAGPLLTRRPAVGHLLTWALLPALALPSVLAAAERFQPRQDFAGVAAEVADSPGTPLLVLPGWDAPGFERYVRPSARVRRLGGLPDLPAVSSLPDSVDVVLTRQAARDEALRAAAVEHLAPALALTDEQRLRGLWGGIRLLRFRRPRMTARKGADTAAGGGYRRGVPTDSTGLLQGLP